MRTFVWKEDRREMEGKEETVTGLTKRQYDLDIMMIGCQAQQGEVGGDTLGQIMQGGKESVKTMLMR